MGSLYALNPLPAEPFDLSQWSRARVNIDCHIVFDTKYYSVPYNLVLELVEVRFSCLQAASRDGYRSCLGLIRLAGQYSSSRMEAAAERALATGTSRYQVRLKLC